MVPPARTVAAMASTASAMPASVAGSVRAPSGGTEVVAGRLGLVLAPLDQQRRQCLGQRQPLGQRQHQGTVRPSGNDPPQDRRLGGAHHGKLPVMLCHPADRASSGGYRIAPHASHPSITAPLRIWLRRLSGTAVWQAPHAVRDQRHHHRRSAGISGAARTGCGARGRAGSRVSSRSALAAASSASSSARRPSQPLPLRAPGPPPPGPRSALPRSPCARAG